MLGQETGSNGATSLSNHTASNDARMALLERRLRGLPVTDTDAISKPQGLAPPKDHLQEHTALQRVGESDDDMSRDTFSLPPAQALHSKTEPGPAGHKRPASPLHLIPAHHAHPARDVPRTRSPSPYREGMTQPAGGHQRQSPVHKAGAHADLSSKAGPGGSHRTPQSNKRQRRTISQYFHTQAPQGKGSGETGPSWGIPHGAGEGGSPPSCTAPHAAGAKDPQGHDRQDGTSPDISAAPSHGSPSAADLARLVARQCQQLEAMQAALEQYRGRVERGASEAAAAATRSQQERERLLEQVEELSGQLQRSRDGSARRDGQVREAMVKLAQAYCSAYAEAQSARLRNEGLRLGCITALRAGPLGLRESWQDGTAFQALAARQAELSEQRETIEAARKAVRRKLPPPPEPLSQSAAEAASCQDFMTPEDYVARDEVFKVRVAALKRDEEALHREHDRLEAEKSRHLKELRRVRDREGSRFSTCLQLHTRYLLLDLLGKGGFSEVFLALDLESLQEVAVKVHQLNSSWSEAKKVNFVKHALREYRIHRELAHPRIVGLLDIFEIDTHTFATVLETCRGGDLESYLKEHQVLPEKEARVITAQVCSGLAYLNNTPRRIIHMDLKPANCLFDQYGQVKLTDFGLSKIVEEGEASSLELTSQGAGTYWYLPPECFQVGPRPPTISSKVDVWSLGVMLFQMLYGKRPFGDGCSQEQVLREEIMLKARQVAFPAKPAVSAEGRDFIQGCLAYRQQDRMDVHAAANHPYLALRRPRSSSGPPAT